MTFATKDMAHEIVSIKIDHPTICLFLRISRLYFYLVNYFHKRILNSFLKVSILELL